MERCGLIINGKFVEMRNVSGDEGEFLMDPVEVLNAVREGTVEAVVHTHDGAPLPSNRDIIGMRIWRVPWVISSHGLVRAFSLVDGLSVLELDVKSLLPQEVYDLIVKLSQ